MPFLVPLVLNTVVEGRRWGPCAGKEGLLWAPPEHMPHTPLAPHLPLLLPSHHSDHHQAPPSPNAFVLRAYRTPPLSFSK